MGFSLYYGELTSRINIAGATLSEEDLEGIRKVGLEADKKFSKQLLFFKIGIVLFFFWLLIYVFWIVIDKNQKTTPMDSSKCKCWKRPFEPPGGCFNYCAGKILRYAKEDDLYDRLNIDLDLSKKIFEISSDNSLELLSDFKPYFSSQEFEIINSALQKLGNGHDGSKGMWLKRLFDKDKDSLMNIN